MSNTPKNASERVFQDNFVKELIKYKWEAIIGVNIKPGFQPTKNGNRALPKL